MTVRQSLSIISIFILVSCSSKKEKHESVTKAKEVEKPEVATTSIAADNIDYSTLGQEFAQEVLKHTFRLDLFDSTQVHRFDILKIFEGPKLENIAAYSNKNYPKNSKPKHYDHFTLLVASYQNAQYAKNSFDEIKTESQYVPLKETTRSKLLRIYSKYGGLITQKGRQIFCLVETCRDAPIGKSWIEYENRFLELLICKDEEIEVLNADCGTREYRVEQRLVQ